MAMDQAAPTRLAFGATFRAAFGGVFGSFWTFVKAALLPIALSIALALVSLALMASALGSIAAPTSDPVDTVQSVLNLLLQILGLLPLAILGIACHRLMLLGRQAGAIPRPLLGWRMLVYLGYMMLFGVIAALPAMAVGFAMVGDAVVAVVNESDEVQMQNPAMVGGAVLLLFLFYLVYLYFLTRLSLVFPAVAVDRKLGLLGSWRLTRGGSGFKLYALLVVITLLCMVGTLIGMFIINTMASLLWLTPDLAMRGGEIDWTIITVSQIPNAIGALLFEYLGFILILAAVTAAYAQLSGWGAPRQDILERFE